MVGGLSSADTTGQEKQPFAFTLARIQRPLENSPHPNPLPTNLRSVPGEGTENEHFPPIPPLTDNRQTTAGWGGITTSETSSPRRLASSAAACMPARTSATEPVIRQKPLPPKAIATWMRNKVMRAALAA